MTTSRFLAILFVISTAILFFVSNNNGVNAQYVCYANGVPLQRSLATCYWYNSKSCCTVQQSQNIQSSFNSVGTQVGNVTIPEWVKDIFLPCLDQLNLFVCFPCDGSQTNYLKYNIIMQRQEFTVCQTFCDRMYDKCRLVPIDSQGNLIGTKYKDGSSMCLGEFGPRIKDWTMLVDTQNCFNSSPQTATLSFRLIALLVICSSAALFLFL